MVYKKKDSYLMNRIKDTSNRGCVLPENRLDTQNGRKLISDLSWRTLSVRTWNQLHMNLRIERNLTVFKPSLKNWVIKNTRLRL